LFVAFESAVDATRLGAFKVGVEPQATHKSDELRVPAPAQLHPLDTRRERASVALGGCSARLPESAELRRFLTIRDQTARMAIGPGPVRAVVVLRRLDGIGCVSGRAAHEIIRSIPDAKSEITSCSGR
jgi:hypothetical protein